MLGIYPIKQSGARPPPICKNPVGDGANRVTIVLDINAPVL